MMLDQAIFSLMALPIFTFLLVYSYYKVKDVF